MEPLIAAEAAARKALAEAAGPQGVREVAAETAETLVGEQGLLQQLETIRFDSIESLAARNEAALSEVRREGLAGQSRSR